MTAWSGTMSQSHDEPQVCTHRLPRDNGCLSLHERIAHAARRIVGSCDEQHQEQTSASYDLRSDQSRVFQDFASFLQKVTSGLAEPWGRIILPPRTGKTVIAGHIVARSGLHATFIVPTKTLVMQTAREFRALLPNVPVGVYFSEQKELVADGVNITTYSILLRDHQRGQLPRPIASAELIFADEAHHVMTERRLNLLQRGFAQGAVHLALTATPDYDDKRRVLCRFFPYLIHELTLEEALALGLLAPARVWVAEVNAEGSRVRILAGDYEEATLGRIMSAAPFSRAVQVFRYSKVNATLSALIACTSRQQAYDLQAYLVKHRPHGTPAPEVILGETAPADRIRILDEFENGRVDTIIQVGVLVEGWSSARCKLLIDLAPTLSRVRATQKYFRAMTRDGDAEARIYVLLPSELPAMPILPMELFGRSCQEYECGQLLGATDSATGVRADVERFDQTPVAGVFLKRRILLSARISAPTLDPQNLDDIRAVLASNGDFNPHAPHSLRRFCGMNFDHPLFRGRGAFLLRWLGISQHVQAYAEFLARIFPDSMAVRILLRRDDHEVTSSCYDDARHLLDALPRQPSETWDESIHEGFGAGWRALTGFDGMEPEARRDPFERLVRDEESDAIAYLLSILQPRARIVVAKYFGLFEMPEQSLQVISIAHEISQRRLGQIVARALREFTYRYKMQAKNFKLHFLDKPPKIPISYRMQHHANVMVQLNREVYTNWSSLSSSIPVRELLPRLQMVLDRLHIGASLASATPSFRSWLQDGAEWCEAQWQDRRIVLTLRREGHTFLRHEGDECTVYRLQAELVGLPGKTTLKLTGALGCFEFFRSEGANTEAVDDAWGELCDPTGYWDAKRSVQKPRRKKKRIRERRGENEPSFVVDVRQRLAERSVANATTSFYGNRIDLLDIVMDEFAKLRKSSERG